MIDTDIAPPQSLEYLTPQNALKQKLTELGITLPQSRNTENLRTLPDEWIVRGESDKNRLIDPSKRVFKPTFGKGATFGVFFGDNYDRLAYPSNGAFYIMNKSHYQDIPFLAIPSEEYHRKMAEMAQNRGLDIKKINDGMKAENLLYQAHPVYEPKMGIITFNNELPVSEVDHILVSPKFLEYQEYTNLPPEIKTKIDYLRS